MLSNFFRAIIIYIFVLLVMRLMGKREIGQLHPFELAISIMIADLASIPMSDVGTPILNGLIPILGLLVMHLLISVLNMKSLKFREVICGKPSILIYRGRIDEKILKKERFNINELEERVLIQRKDNRILAEENLDLKEKIENKDFEVSERIRLMQNQVNKYERLIKKVPENIIEKIQKKEKNRKNRERYNKR